MALLQLDGFNHYGPTDDTGAPGQANMLAGTYSAVDTAIQIATPPWGARSCVYSLGSFGSTTGAVRSLATATDPLLFGFAYSLSALPTAAGKILPIVFLDASAAVIAALSIETDGSIGLRTGSAFGTLLAKSSVGVMPLGEWVYFEMLLAVADQGFSLIMYTDSDSGPVATTLFNVGPVTFGGSGSCAAYALLAGAVSSTFNNPTQWCSDFGVCDTTDTVNFDFMGVRYVATVLPDADVLADQEWAGFPNIPPSAYLNVAKLTPDDTSYIAAAASGNVSQFYFARLPADAVTIVGAALVSREFLPSAGAATVKTSLIGALGDASDGAPRDLTTTPTLYSDVFQFSADVSADPLQPLDLINGAVRVTRTA